MNKPDDFLAGIFIGFIIMFVSCVVFVHNSANTRGDMIEKRCVELNCGTYVSENFQYTNGTIEYILTGKK